MNLAAAEASYIEAVVSQHADEAAFLWTQRHVLVSAPDITLRALARHDERLSAQIDGLRIAGEPGRRICQALLAGEDPGAMFAAMVMATENRDAKQIAMLLALAEAVPAMRDGLAGALGWVSSQFLQGTVKELLASHSPFRRWIGLVTCVMHQVALGQTHEVLLESSDTVLRARALRAVGELGRTELRPRCEEHLNDAVGACRFNAAWSAILLGDRISALKVLKELAFTDGPFQDQALFLVLGVVPVKEGHQILKDLAADSSRVRSLVKGAGIVGDPFYFSWLIKQMEVPELARLAGEALSLATGLDFSSLGLDDKRVGSAYFGPNDDPDDENVTMDEDDGLAWPAPSKVHAWWQANQARFAAGERYFMGEPLTTVHCRRVLRGGCQRQRMAAAEILCFLQPGTQLFPTRAPAWRQARWLGRME
ncbi:MAG TPA: TIGR02270 family protein [Pseudoduganella sp.]